MEITKTPGGNYITTTKPCPECGQASKIELTPEQNYAVHYSGKHIQDALPDWSPGQRELFLTGMHPACWDKVMSDELEDL